MMFGKTICEKLGINIDQLNSMYVACPVGGYLGTEVADQLRKKFGLGDGPLGEELYAKGILTEAEGRWLDDKE